LKTYRIRYSRAALRDIHQLLAHITAESSSRIAQNYIGRLREFCSDLSIAPHRGEQREGLPHSYRSIGFGHRISVVFSVSDSESLVRIIRFYYAGENWTEDDLSLL